MKNGYQLLMTLTYSLNKSYPLVKEILKEDKEAFSYNEKNIHIALGILNEIKEIAINLDEEIYILNKKLYEALRPLINYSNRLFDKNRLVNTYKLYDSLKLDLANLRNLLNNLKDF